MDAGSVTNQATAQGTDPLENPVNDPSGGTAGDDEPTVTALPRLPSLVLTKGLATGSGPSFDAPGDVLNYTFAVRNTGNVTITAAITDPLITGAGGTTSCTPPPLAPGATTVCTGSFTVTRDNFDAVQIINIAKASDGTTTSPPANLTIYAVQTPRLTATKLAEPITPAQFVVGATVAYTYTITNDGNARVTAPIRINDNLVPAANLTCDPVPVGGLAPLAALTCTGTYTVTSDDVDLGAVTNNATATGTTSTAGPVTSPIVSETVPDGAVPVPVQTIAKTAAPGSVYAAIGDEITYNFTVTNTGTRTFVQPVTFFDPLFAAPITCFTPTADDLDFTAGETANCSGIYTVTQADLDVSEVVNEAVAQTTFGAGAQTVSSEPDTATVTAALPPALTLTEEVLPNPVSAVGQHFSYRLAVTNSGNQTIRNIILTDPLLPDLVYTIATLAPQGELFCSDNSYAVTQADVDRGNLVNNAFVAGTTPLGGPVNGTATATAEMPASAAALQLTKSANPSPFGAVGSTVSYSVAVRNAGNTTVADMVVIDPIDPAFACTITRLVPGEVDTSCSLNITVAQAQIDAGEIINTATVTAGVPFDTPVQDTDTITTPSPASAPAPETIKTLTRLGGAAVTPVTIAFVSSDLASLEGTPMPGETATYSVIYILV